MLSQIRKFFDEFMATDATSAVDPTRAGHCAAAALLLEMAYMDEVVTPEEQTAIVTAVKDRFGLAPEETEALMACAHQEREQATDYFQFTSLINTHFDAEQKAALVEELWRVAYADQVLCKHQEYLVRRISNLLHVPHSTFIATKLRVTG